MKIVYDPDIPATLQPSIQKIIKESVTNPCPCGCNEIYVSVLDDKLDIKCYDCGTSFFELEVEVGEETVVH